MVYQDVLVGVTGGVTGFTVGITGGVTECAGGVTGCVGGITGGVTGCGVMVLCQSVRCGGVGERDSQDWSSAGPDRRH